MNRTEIIQAILDERKRQDDKWGQQNHNIWKWLAILGEEYGEACKAALQHEEDVYITDFSTEFIHVAAVAIAIVECIDRIRNIQK